MKRIARVIVWLVALVAAALIVLIVAANHNPRSNRIPNWRLNLEQIELAKHEWASDRVGTTNDAPTFDDLQPYLSDWMTNHISWTNGQVVDPDGGVYTIGHLDEPPSCLIGGHKLHL